MEIARSRQAPRALRARLLPLHIAVGLQGMLLWLPVEKIFLNQIGFTAASIGLMAAVYAGVTPLLEVPSGILADRWSRRGVLILSALALMAASLVGGLSNGVPLYLVSAVILGVYFAMYSGTVESIVYDVVLEETGSSNLYQQRLGRVRLVESVSLVVSSLLGGVLAGVTTPRLTYFVSVPFAGLAILAYLRFKEPLLHKADDRGSLRRHVSVTYNALLRGGVILPVVLLGALTSLAVQVIFEFGPLWLVAFAAPAVLFGPYWAGLVSTLGVGGVLASRIRLADRSIVGVVVIAMVAASVVLNVSRSVAAVIAAQVVLAFLLTIAGIHASNLLHDAVPSSIRAGVASGVSTLSWIGFLPFALGFGWVTREYGVHTSGWMITVAVGLVGVLLTRMSTSGPRPGSLSDDVNPGMDDVPLLQGCA
jgi:predicted MFS family arabinose efflux permease